MIKLLLYLLKLILKITPLWLVQVFGIIIGKLFHFFNKKSRLLLIKNIDSSGLFLKKDLRAAIRMNINETGKTIAESFFIWANSEKKILGLIKKVHGVELIKKAQKEKKGIIFLTPHMGCYEIAPVYYGSLYPITVLYRPSRKRWVDEFMFFGRQKGFVKLAPTNNAGVRGILKALNKGEAVGILPDQAANKGEGLWVPFFNRPAYTMVLVSRLVMRTGAPVIIAYVERLSLNKGFEIHLKYIEPHKIKGPLELNQLLEEQIKNNPTQYLWNYDKHKGYESQLNKNT
jgi:Kdo2-lipid IVA lauroyltransferase/acyltransferase